MNRYGKKFLSWFLATIIAVSSMSVGLVAFAESAETAKENGELLSQIIDDIEKFALEDNYINLQKLLSSNYVADKNNYSVSGNYVTAKDNADEEITKAAEEFFKIALSIYSTSNSSSAANNTNVKVGTSIKNELKARMGEDYAKYNVDAVITYMIGGNTKVSTTNEFGFTVNAPSDYSYLLKYEKTEDIPDSILISRTFAFKHTSSGLIFKTYFLESITKRENTFDTQSGKVFRDFSKMFSDKTLATSPEKLDKDKLSEINENGRQLIDLIKSYSVDIIAHFLGTASITAKAEAYLESVKLEILNVYKRAVDKIKDGFGNTKPESLSREETNSLGNALDSANEIYNSFSEEQKNSDVVLSSKAEYDKLYSLYLTARNIYLTADYNERVLKMSELLKLSVVNSVSSSEAADDTKGTVSGFALIYKEIVGILQTIDFEKYSTAEKINDKLNSDLKSLLGADYDLFNTKSVIDFVSGKGTNEFSATEDKLTYGYKNIYEIPKTFKNLKTVYSYIYESGNLVEIKVSNSEITDNTSYLIFNQYKNLFTDELLNKNLESSFSFLELNALYDEFEKALLAVNFYSDKVKENLLSYNYERAKEMPGKTDFAMASMFSGNASVFYSKYFDKEISVSEREKFSKDALFVTEMYDALSYDAQQLEITVNAYKLFQKTLESVENFIEYDNYRIYLFACKEFANYITVNGDTIQYNKLEVIDIAPLKVALAGVRNRYSALSDSVKEYDDVKKCVEITEELSARLKEIINKKEWKKTEADYPKNVSEKDMQKVVLILEDILRSPVVENALGDSLQNTIMSALNGVFTEELVNTIVSFLYPFVHEQVTDYTSLLPLVGLYVTPSGMAGRIDKNKYPAAVAALSAGGSDWDKVNWENVDWGEINNVDDFCDALGEAFKGILPMLKALLTGDNVTAIFVTIITGNKGYNNDILPLLEALGCQDVLSTAEFEAQKNNPSEMLKAIIKPILNRVDGILAEDTVGQILSLVPNLSYIFLYDLLVDGIADLGSPLSTFGVDLVAIFKDMGIDITDPVDMINSFISSLGITLPQINFAKSAGLGTFETADSGRLNGKRNTITANREDVSIEVLKYVVKTVKFNQHTIWDMLENSGIDHSLLNTIKKIIIPVFSNSDKVISGKIVELLCALGKAAPDFDWDKLNMLWQKSEFAYPAGVTEKQTENVIKILDKLIKQALPLLTDSSLNGIITSNLYTNNIAASLMTTVFSALEDETAKTVLDVLNVDASVSGVASLLSPDYPEVANIIARSNSWKQINPSELNFNVTDKSSFVNALSAVFRPFSQLLDVILNGASLDIAETVTLGGANGYKNSILPLLTALGCKTAVSASDYSKYAEEDLDNLIKNIISPILDLVDTISHNPVAGLTGLLPNIAYFLNNNGLSIALQNLLLPVTHLVDIVLPLVTEKDLMSYISEIADLDFNLNNLEDSVVSIANSLLKSINIGGKNLSLTIPQIDYTYLAGMGTLKNGTVTADNNQVLITVLRYAHKLLVQNRQPVTTLVSGMVSGETGNIIENIINNILSISSDRFINVLFGLLTDLGGGGDYFWKFKNLSYLETAFTQNYGREEYQYALDNIDEVIFGLLNDLLGGKSLKSMIGGMLYTNSTMNTLVGAVYKAIGSIDIGIDINSVLSMLGMDLTPSGLAGLLTEKKYSSVRNALSKSDVWQNISFDNVSWGIKDGSKDDFSKALAAALRPIQPLLRFLLAGEDIVILDTLTIKGSVGYNSAIIPILEALGCKQKNIVSVADYQRNLYTDDILLFVLNPLLDRVEDILESPFNTLSEILPNIAYFFHNGSLGTIVNNLIEPITRILDSLSPIYNVNLDLSAINNLKIIKTVNSLVSNIDIGGKQLGISLLEIDAKSLSSRGTQKTILSERTFNGTRQTVKVVEADRPAVFITALRYVINNLKTEKNINAIQGLLSGASLDDSLSDIVNTAFEMLATQDTDEIIETLYDLLFGTGENPSDIIKDLELEKSKKLKQYNMFLFWTVFWAVIAVIVLSIKFLIDRQKKKKGLTADKKTGVGK